MKHNNGCRKGHKETSKSKVREQQKAPNELAALHKQPSWRCRWGSLAHCHFFKQNDDHSALWSATEQTSDVHVLDLHTSRVIATPLSFVSSLVNFYQHQVMLDFDLLFRAHSLTHGNIDTQNGPSYGPIINRSVSQSYRNLSYVTLFMGRERKTTLSLFE